MKADKNKIVDKVMEDVSKSSILPETKIALLMCSATNIMLNDIDRELRKKYILNGINAKCNYESDNILTGMANYCKAVRTAMYWFERDTEKRIADATFGSYGVESFDWFMASANEIAQIVMLVVDRCTGKDNTALEKVKAFLKGMDGAGYFSDEDIERFKLR